jgi:tetrahydromethanopterin S-methyltransferase subunit F
VVVDVAGREKTDITVTVIEKPNIQEVNVKVNDVDTPTLPISR